MQLLERRLAGVAMIACAASLQLRFIVGPAGRVDVVGSSTYQLTHWHTNGLRDIKVDQSVQPCTSTHSQRIASNMRDNQAKCAQLLQAAQLHADRICIKPEMALWHQFILDHSLSHRQQEHFFTLVLLRLVGPATGDPGSYSASMH
jgi:hypothetical protein